MRRCGGSQSISTRVAKRAANAAKKSADIAENALYVTQRAYISVRPEWSIEVDSDGNIVSIGFWTKQDNQGNTPAVRVVNKSRSDFLPKADNKFSYDGSAGHIGQKTTVGPRSDIVTDRQVFTVNYIRQISDGNAPLFLSGWLEYDDIFSGTPRHGVEWCFEFTIEGNLKRGECQGRFDVYGEHNQYYDCPPSPVRTSS